MSTSGDLGCSCSAQLSSLSCLVVANDISATDAVRTTEEGVEAIVASGVVSRISRVGEGVELFDLTRLNVRFDGL